MNVDLSNGKGSASKTISKNGTQIGTNDLPATRSLAETIQ